MNLRFDRREPDFAPRGIQSALGVLKKHGHFLPWHVKQIMLPVKIKKLSDKAVIPKYAESGSAGMDMVATSMKAYFQGAIAYVEYGTDLAIEIPEGFVGLIYPRSSISSATTFVLANSVGVIDSSYRGEIKFRFKSITPVGRLYNVGDRIGQIVIMPYPQVQFEEVTELSDTDRGTGGYGSTGK